MKTLIQYVLLLGGLFAAIPFLTAQVKNSHFGIHQLEELPSKPIFEHLTPLDGLSSSTVNYILQDKNGYIWLATNDGLNRYDGRKFLTFRKREGLSSSIVNELEEDQRGNIWVVTVEGLDVLLPQQLTLHSLLLPSKKALTQKTGKINKLIFTKEENTIYVGAENGFYQVSFSKQFVITKLVCLYEKTVYDLAIIPRRAIYLTTAKGILHYPLFSDILPQPIKALSLPCQSIYIHNKATIYASSLDGQLIQYDLNTEQTKWFRDKQLEWQQDLITELFVDAYDRLWVLSYGDGIHVLDTRNMALLHSYQHESNNPNSLQTNVLEYMMISRAGILWIGTASGGADMLNPFNHKQAFRLIQNAPSNNMDLRANGIHGIHIAPDNMISLGMDGGGLHFLKPDAKNHYEYIATAHYHTENTKNFPSEHLYGIYPIDNSNFWVLNWNGLAHFNKPSKQFHNFPLKTGETGEQAVMTLAKDSSGINWIGTRYNGVAYFDEQQYPNIEFNWFNTNTPLAIPDNRVEAIHIDKYNQVWIGTIGGGISVLSANRTAFTHYRHQPDDTTSLSSDLILYFHQENDTILWIGTHGGGLNKMNLITKKIQAYTTEDGLANNVVYAILPDEQGNLWMSTNLGISKFNPQEETFQNFDVQDGLQDNEFNRHAAFKAKDGTLYFGGINGLSFFNPADIRKNTYIPPIVISEIKVNQQSIPIVESLELDYDQNLLAFEFASLNYQQPSKNQYRFQLVGVDKNWIEGGIKNDITYSHLLPGSYQLRVKGSNNDGLWNEEGIILSIKILPPWWQTNWAYGIYALLIAILLYSAYHFLLNKKLAEAENNRLLELDNLKTNLYTNITHEFRTPLTVIQGMTNELENRPTHKRKEKLHLIKKNSQNLLSLVNQMLDLSKLQAGKVSLNLQQADVIAFLRLLTESHESFAKLHQIDLQFYSEEDNLLMDFDEKKIAQVMINLLTNAIKFTREYGKILVVVKRKDKSPTSLLEIIVKDTGIGIATEEIPYIFDRFHQSHGLKTAKGTGIGLALVKELVNLMKGAIVVKSELHRGTTFNLSLPIQNKEALIQNTNFYSFQKPVITDAQTVSLPKQYSKNLPILLIIEDNIDVIYYLQNCLEEQYQIITATNGKTGLAKAFEALPDIIISDVMMPKMDGFEVCRQLKTDERTNHIPIILLTAKATQKDKLEGLNHGADAYLLKPFEKEELLTRLDNLMKLRRLLQLKYSQQLLSENPSRAKEESVQDVFIRKAEQIILDNLEDENFGGNALAQALHLSYSQTYRKIKALTGKSVTIYIRHIRLQKAKKLLLSEELTISEIAYQTGFKSPVYFSQVFKTLFGKAPSAIRGKEQEL